MVFRVNRLYIVLVNSSIAPFCLPLQTFCTSLIKTRETTYLQAISCMRLVRTVAPSDVATEQYCTL